MMNDQTTIGEKYRPAMNITDPAEAERYLEECIAHTLSFDHNKQMTREEALLIEKQNLGYFAGYYDTETRERVERLFDCMHPIFGKASEGIPAAEEAFQMGVNAGGKDSK